MAAINLEPLPSFNDQITAWYQDYLGRTPTPDELASHRGNPGGLPAIEQEIKGQAPAPGPTRMDAPIPPVTPIQPTPQPGPQPPPTGESRNTAQGAPGVNDFYNTPFTAPASVNLGGPAGIPYIPPTPAAPPTPQPGPAPVPDLPVYNRPGAFSYQDYPAPTPFAYADWKAPTVEEALNEPGYQFRFQQGMDALQRSAAARGVLNDSGTAKGLIDYGQGAAGSEYQNVWNRGFNAYQTGRRNALDTYNTNESNRFGTYATNRAGAVDTYNRNYKTQFTDPYQYAYQAATDTWSPGMENWRTGVDLSKLGYNTATDLSRLGYSTQAAAGQRQNELNLSNAWDARVFDYNKFRNYQRDIWDRAYQYGQL